MISLRILLATLLLTATAQAAPKLPITKVSVSNPAPIDGKSGMKRPIFGMRQRLFWTHEIPFRVASVWRAIKYQFRILIPPRSPRIEWS